MTTTSDGSFDLVHLRESMARRLRRRSVVTSQITLPAVPGMIDDYMAMFEAIFASVGRKFTSKELEQLRAVLEGQLALAYAGSQRSDIVVSLDAPIGKPLTYNVRPVWVTIEGAYEHWIATREPPLFGTQPDARVWMLANGTSDPETFRILEIGPGTGRNALPLARRGHPVDVVEVTAKFAEMIRIEALRESLDVRVIQRDALSGATEDLRRDYQLIVLSEVVPEFRTSEDLRRMFGLAAQCLASDGQLVFNTFLTKPGYVLDDAARALGEQCYSSIFTPQEMTESITGLPLELVDDKSVYEYEKAHLPDGAWPPTGWYAGWVTGLDVFDVAREQCPIELRWQVYQKTS